MKAKEETIVASQQQIVTTFMEYYKKLYETELTPDKNIKKFLNTLPVS